MRRYFKTTTALLTLLAFLTSFVGFIHSSQPPQMHTGADGVYCNQCHSTNPLNNPGGSVAVTGIPDNFTAGVSYNFSLTTNHSTADRVRWGFSIEARNSQGMAVGTFSTTNANADLNGAELSHKSAVSTGMQASYTYNNLIWTAPANVSPNDENITFYFVGNAANGSGSSGDFIYAGTKSVRLLKSAIYTFTGNGNWDNPTNWSNNQVPPLILTGPATIVIDPPAGSECVLNVEQHLQGGATFTVKEGKAFRIIGGLFINNQ